MNDDCIVRLEHMSLDLGAQAVHRDISLCVHRGEILGLVGRSGSGKTLLLRAMTGLQAPDRGQVYVFGRRLDRLTPREFAELHRRCGILFQNGALFSAFDVFDNVAFPLRESGYVDEALVQQLVYLKLGMVGLDADAAARLPAELSGGMVKRAALARALALEPELLFLDEPTSGLDPIASQEFMQLLSDLHQELGFTVVMVTHDLDLMHDLCQRLAVLADQQLVALGTPEEVRRCEHPFVREFFHGAHARRVFDSQSKVHV